jgi:nucleotide-binding universal stress UspA family protein
MKVLVPVDGSRYALEALHVAIDFVKTKGGEISVISVVPYIGGMDDHEISPARRERHMGTFEKRADEIVKQACDILSAAKITAGCTKNIVTSVSVADAIVDFAETEKIDLIVMGSRGLTVSSRIKLGSVAVTVAKHSPCSVYLVKPASSGD